MKKRSRGWERGVSRRARPLSSIPPKPCHLDRRRRTLPPQWRNPQLPLSLPVLPAEPQIRVPVACPELAEGSGLSDGFPKRLISIRPKIIS
jgi:hypothetical protein